MDPEDLLRKLQKSKAYRQKRSFSALSTKESPNFINKHAESPDEHWKKRKSEILEKLQILQGKEVTKVQEIKGNEEKTDVVNKEEMLMNIELMNGEIPKIFKLLLNRFKIADIFLRKNHPRMSKLLDINNYMVLSDCKLSFNEIHVQNIVYLYPYTEVSDTPCIAYILGRTKPTIPTESSILMLKLPQENKSSVKDQLLLLLGSSRNLNGVFSSMAEEERKDILQVRYDTLEKHIVAYIDAKYEEYVKRENVKPPEKGRLAGFTMKELGALPLGDIPPPILFVKKTAQTAIEEIKRDVEQAIKENKLPPVSPRKPKGFRKSLDVDFSVL